MIKITGALIVCAMALLLAGCRTMSSGGAPESSFDLQTDKEALASQFGTAATIGKYYSTATEGLVEARNRFIAGRLALIDLNYLQYVQLLTADKQRLNTAAELANMSLGLAGTLVGGVRAKTNLAAAATGLGGTKTTIDKEYYYEKSLDALIDAMNAKRKDVLVGILTGRATSSIADYSFEQALTQLNEYYMAGTINGALRFISAHAATQEKASDVAISNIPELTETTKAIVTNKRALTSAIDQSDRGKAIAALQELKQPVAPGAGLDDLKNQLTQVVRGIKGTVEEKETAIKKIQAAFTKVGLMN